MLSHKCESKGGKEMVDVDKLRGKIAEKRMTVSSLAETIGINKGTLYRKINGMGEPITIKEADDIVKALDISASEAMAIFFSQFVA